MDPAFRRFAAAVLRANPRRLTWVTLVQAAASVGQVAGLFLLIPMLGAVGITTSGSADGIVRFWRDLFDTIGLELTLRTMLVVYVVTIGVAATLNAYATILMARYRADYTRELRNELYAAIARAEWRHLAGVRGSDLLVAVTTNVAQVSAAALGILALLSALLLSTAQLIVAARLSLPVMVLAAFSSAVLIGLVWPFIGRTRRAGNQSVEGLRTMMASFREFVDGLRLVKAHALEAQHETEFLATSELMRDAEMRLATAGAVSGAIQLVATAAVLAIVVGVAIETFEVDLASLLVLAFIFMRLVPVLTGVQRNLQQVATGLGAFEAVTQLQRACEDASEDLGSGTPRAIGQGVIVRGVSFHYGSREVLRDVSFTIPVGATVALVGPSGAGKTTLVDLIVGLLQPSEGEVVVDGRPLGRDSRGWRASIALVPQDPFLFNDTVRANLQWVLADASDAAMWDALRQAAAEDLVRSLPAGLDTIVGDRGIRLSGGERQRIALARALLRSPQLLVLDEATSSLDTENEQLIRTALNDLHGELTMLVIAHRLSTVRHADHVVVLDEGRVAEQGTWDELVGQAEGRLRALVEAGLVD